jgi:hypothetical protein
MGNVYRDVVITIRNKKYVVERENEKMFVFK